MLTKRAFAQVQEHVASGNWHLKTDIERICAEALLYEFATVYVKPNFVSFARSLVGDRLGVGTGVAFPFGAATTRLKMHSALRSIGDGADNLDVVANIARLREDDFDYVARELDALVEAIRKEKPDTCIKVIIETPVLTAEQKRRAAELCIAAGADYIKMSTGTLVPSSFSLGDVRFLKSVVGDRIKIKASGCIHTIEDAVGAIMLGASRIGNSEAVRWLSEFDGCAW